jgi:hypothetical protein
MKIKEVRQPSRKVYTFVETAIRTRLLGQRETKEVTAGKTEL